MKKIFIGCSSYETIDSKYLSLASEVGKLCISKNYSLVFGARNKGMMAALYNEYMGSNIPFEAITTWEYKRDIIDLNPKCAKHISKNTLEQVEYFQKSDILLFLPGGIGSLNEFISSITAKRNKEMNSKIILFNYENYYNELLNLFEKFIKEGFSIKEDLFIVVNTLEELEKEL